MYFKNKDSKQAACCPDTTGVAVLPSQAGRQLGAVGARPHSPSLRYKKKQELQFRSSNAKNDIYDQKAWLISGDCESAEGLL